MKIFNPVLIISGLFFAFITRIALPFNKVFTEHGIVLNTPDAYAMVRHADVEAFVNGIDYFSIFPEGVVISKLFYSSIISVLSNLTGTTTLFISALLPPILFFLTAYAVYWIASILFEYRAGAISVFMLCILPGEFLNRTMLGAGDYHCLEIAIVSFIMLFVVTMITVPHNLVKVLLAIGIVGLYIAFRTAFSWPKEMILIAIILISALITGFFYLCKTNIAKILYLAIITFCITLVYVNFSAYMPVRLLSFIDPRSYVTEEMTFFFTNGQFDLMPMMAYFGITFYVVLFGIGWLIYRVFKYQRAGEVVLLVWTVVMFTIMLCMRRWEYYFAINAAIITAFVIVKFTEMISRKNAVRMLLIVAIAICLPLGRQSIVTADSDYGYPDKHWIETCEYLQSQNDSDYEAAYYTGEKPAYGAFSAWTYGYWIQTIGHQAVWSHNGAGDRKMERSLLLASDEQAALEYLRDAKIRYVILSGEMFKFQSLQSDNVTFMYKAYEGQIADLELVNWSGNVKVLRIRN
jgi:asparagine N-glycosylation enzyme membrane subunit Stt3